ncbi:MAG: tRNA (N(6)-L-threonylcarbamoyladenosine(37)-C(2))-methylthiotransferase [Candidatus Micrarchaeia archaeon]
MKVFIKTYGCTLNQADSDIMISLLKTQNFEIVDSEEIADVVVVNTCTVKQPTEEKILNHISKIYTNKKKIVAAGCLATASPDKIKRYAPNSIIVTTTNIDKIIEAVVAAYKNENIIYNSKAKLDKVELMNKFGAIGSNKNAGVNESISDSKNIQVYSGNTSIIENNIINPIIAKIPINEGCLGNCTFCETRISRGKLNSFSEEQILNAIKFSAERGVKEIQLTSQDAGAYGFDKSTNIIQLMKKIVDIKDPKFKIRIAMMNPEHLIPIVDEFLALLKNPHFYKFIHIPVQAGSNRVLKDMKRRYTREEFLFLVDKIKKHIPNVAIETDIIAGYPTETIEDFQETISLVKSARFDIVNMSRFWKREHTQASKLKQLSNKEIMNRSIELARVVRRIQKEINDSYINKYFNAVVTEENEYSFNARIDSYKKVIIKKVKYKNNLKLGSMIGVKISSATANVLYAEKYSLLSDSIFNKL